MRNQAAQKEVSSGWAKLNLSFPITPHWSLLFSIACITAWTITSFPHPPGVCGKIVFQGTSHWCREAWKLLPHGLQPTKLLCSWGYPGKNTGVGCHFFLQGVFPLRLNQCLLHLLYRQGDSLPLHYPGSPSAHPCYILRRGFTPVCLLFPVPFIARVQLLSQYTHILFTAFSSAVHTKTSSVVFPPSPSICAPMKDPSPRQVYIRKGKSVKLVRRNHNCNHLGSCKSPSELWHIYFLILLPSWAWTFEMLKQKVKYIYIFFY